MMRGFQYNVIKAGGDKECWCVRRQHTGLSAGCLMDGGFSPPTGAKRWFQPGAGVSNELALIYAPILNLHLLIIHFRT